MVLRVAWRGNGRYGSAGGERRDVIQGVRDGGVSEDIVRRGRGIYLPR